MPWLSLSPAAMVIIFLSVTNALTFGIWRYTAHSLGVEKEKVVTCQAKYADYIARSKAEGDAAIKRAKTIETENRRIADETATGWAAAIESVRADAARRLRNATRNSGRGAMPAIAPDRPGNAQAGADAIPPPERVAADCAETTVTANFLQSFIEKIQNE